MSYWVHVLPRVAGQACRHVANVLYMHACMNKEAIWQGDLAVSCAWIPYTLHPQEARRLHRGRKALSVASFAIFDALAARRAKGQPLMPLAEGLLSAVHPSSGRRLSRDEAAAEIALQMIGQESVPWTVTWAM
jgi:cytochrome P450